MTRIENLLSTKVSTVNKIDVTFAELHDRFSVKTLKIKELAVVQGKNESHPFSIITDNDEFKATDRFINTLVRQKGLSPEIFNLFSYSEVFSRFSRNDPDYEFKVTIDNANREILGAIPKTRKLLEVDKVLDIVREDDRLSGISYSTGVLSVGFNNKDTFSIANDSKYEKRFNFNYSVDGLNQPNFNLSLVRVVCSNGATMVIKEYRTDAIISDNNGDHLRRILTSFNNEDGFEKLAKRLNVAEITPCSLDELSKFENYLLRNCHKTEDSRQLISILEDYAGQPKRRLGVSNLNSIPEIRRKNTYCSINVLDLFNIGTEILSHHESVITKTNMFDNYLAKLLDNHFDFEEVEKKQITHSNFYLNDFKETSVINEFPADDINDTYSYDYDVSDFCQI